MKKYLRSDSLCCWIGQMSCFLLLSLALSLVLCPSANAQGKEKKMKGFTSAPFGKTKEGNNVTVFTLTNANGLSAKILDFGGVLYSMEIPDRNGNFDNISANYATVPEYQAHRPFFGSLVGRYGNRIANGKFTLDGKEYQLPCNNGKNALHGGLKGFDQVIWFAKAYQVQDTVGLALHYIAKDGEEGYPGEISVGVIYKLTDDNELIIEYRATTNKATVLNLTNHTFWNLGGARSGSILNHEVQLGATHFLPTDATLIPTGEVRAVDGTPLDFRTRKAIGRDIAKITEPQFNGGYDHCLILDPNWKNTGEQKFCASVYDPKTGRKMEITTNQPAVQFYTGNFLDGSTKVGDYKYEKHYAFCLETQHYPDSPNQPKFPTTVLRPNEEFTSKTIHKFSIDK